MRFPVIDIEPSMIRSIMTGPAFLFAANSGELISWRLEGCGIM
jgi:hypothetical protein